MTPLQAPKPALMKNLEIQGCPTVNPMGMVPNRNPAAPRGPYKKRLSLRYETFAVGLVSGIPLPEAYIAAGYESTGDSVRKNAEALAKHPLVMARVQELNAEKFRIEAEATERAINRTAITKERVARELAKIGFANMADYMEVGPTGDPVLKFGGLTRDQAAALVEMTVDTYVEGRAADAREVRKVKFKLADKRQALMDIAKLFGWIIDRREQKTVDEFEQMDADEIDAWLRQRAAASGIGHRSTGRAPPRRSMN